MTKRVHCVILARLFKALATNHHDLHGVLIKFFDLLLTQRKKFSAINRTTSGALVGQKWQVKIVKLEFMMGRCH